MNISGTILEVQPRLSTDDSGLSNDDIAFDLAENILERLVDNLDIELADRAIFEVTILLMVKGYNYAE